MHAAPALARPSRACSACSQSLWYKSRLCCVFACAYAPRSFAVSSLSAQPHALLPSDMHACLHYLVVPHVCACMYACIVGPPATNTGCWLLHVCVTAM